MQLPVDLTATSVDIDLVERQELRTLPDVADHPEEDDDGEGEAGLEEALSRVALATVVGRVDGDVDLRDEDDDGHEEADPGTVDTENVLERDLVEGVTLALPGSAEADVGKADGTPGEEGGKTRAP